MAVIRPALCRALSLLRWRAAPRRPSPWQEDHTFTYFRDMHPLPGGAPSSRARFAVVGNFTLGSFFAEEPGRASRRREGEGEGERAPRGGPSLFYNCTRNGSSTTTAAAARVIAGVARRRSPSCASPPSSSTRCGRIKNQRA